jgi:hypothetical protein
VFTVGTEGARRAQVREIGQIDLTHTGKSIDLVWYKPWLFDQGKMARLDPSNPIKGVSGLEGIEMGNNPDRAGG